MLLFSLPELYATLTRFARSRGETVTSAAEVRPAWLRAVSRAQGSRVLAADGPSVGWGDPPRGRLPDLAEFGAVRPLAAERRERTRAAIDEALAELRVLDPALHTFFHTQVGVVEVLEGDVYGAISGPCFLGGTAAFPEDAWDTRRWVETLAHESMHLHLCAAEIVHGLYAHPTAAYDGTVRAPSAIRIGELRTLNGAFHSAYVGVLLLWIRHRYDDPDAVAQTLDEVRTCVEGLAPHRAWFSPYGQAALDGLLAFVDAPAPAQLGDALRARPAAA